MRTNNLFEIWDADAARETEFELIVAKALMCIYPAYHCFPFGGTFKLEDNISRPDIALVAKDMSHWFVIEVELVSHSLDGHVLPQIRTFRYGEPQPDCISVLSRELSMDREPDQDVLDDGAPHGCGHRQQTPPRLGSRAAVVGRAAADRPRIQFAGGRSGSRGRRYG